jgi:hypothetical protein
MIGQFARFRLVETRDQIDRSFGYRLVPADNILLHLPATDFEIFTGYISNNGDQNRTAQLHPRTGIVTRRLKRTPIFAEQIELPSSVETSYSKNAYC